MQWTLQGIRRHLMTAAAIRMKGMHFWQMNGVGE